MSWHKSFFYAFFQSATTRSTGFTTMDITEFSVPTLLVMGVLMFIGRIGLTSYLLTYHRRNEH